MRRPEFKMRRSIALIRINVKVITWVKSRTLVGELVDFFVKANFAIAVVIFSVVYE